MKLVVLDGMNLARRAFHSFVLSNATVTRVPIRSSRGEAMGALLGFGLTAMRIRHELRPTHWAMAWDGPGRTFRHHRYPGYKAHRKPTPPEFLSQLEPLVQLATALGLPVVHVEGYEADDVMASLARQAEVEEPEADVVLVTSDRDLEQMVQGPPTGTTVRVLSPAIRKDEQYVFVDEARVRNHRGVEPDQIPDLIGLVGDSSDNIPGVPSVGQLTGSKLIRQFGSLEALYDNLGDVPTGLRRRLILHRNEALLSRELATLATQVGFLFDIEPALRVRPIRRESLLRLTQRYEMPGLERRALDYAVADADAGEPAPTTTEVTT